MNKLTQFLIKGFCSYKPPAPLVKELRDQTGSSLKECIKVLTEAKGDIVAAKELLRQRGLAQAGKRDDREAKEGVVGILLNDDRKFGTIIELNCETDFVARTDFFVNCIDCLLHTFTQNKIPINKESNLDEILSQTQNIVTQYEEYKGLNLKEVIQISVSKLQENIKVGNIKTVSIDNGILGQYIHQNPIKPHIGSSACLTLLNINNYNSAHLRELSEIADNTAMQILGTKPKYLTRCQIPQDILEEQTQKVRQEMEKALKGKPQNIQDKIIEGKLKQFYEDNVLYNMNYILEGDDGISFEAYLEQQAKQLNVQLAIEGYELITIHK